MPNEQRKTQEIKGSLKLIGSDNNQSDMKSEVDRLKADLDALNQEVYRNNFSAHQDFNKTSNFTTKLIVPHYNSVPRTCQVGEIIESSGKLYICSSANVFTIVGTQT